MRRQDLEVRLKHARKMMKQRKGKPVAKNDGWRFVAVACQSSIDLDGEQFCCRPKGHSGKHLARFSNCSLEWSDKP